jgi:hypothetical protein
VLNKPEGQVVLIPSVIIMHGGTHFFSVPATQFGNISCAIY